MTNNTTPPPSDFDLSSVLAALAKGATTNREKGARFERFIRNLFQKHPGEYSQMFSDVWLWEENWPGKSQYRDKIGSSRAQDIGVDLVGQFRVGGGLCAIQCKFYDRDSVVPTDDINSFIAASPSTIFEKRYFVTTGKPNNVGTKKLEANDVHVIDRVTLEGWPLDWKKYTANPEGLEFTEVAKYKPHDYQAEAISKVVDGFAAQEGDNLRGQLIMPCGVGKSVVALWITEQEELIPKYGRVLYLVPSIALMSQTMREWSRQRSRDHRFFGVCSDTKIAKSDEDAFLTEFAPQVTTDPVKIASYLKPESEDTTVVFCTYQSLPAIVEAQRQGAPEFDLVICDEAHRTTGVEKASDSDKSRMFTLVHDHIALEARRRLYMTATPRLYTSAAKKKARESDADIGLYSMDDVSTFGPVFYQMTFGAAVAGGHLAPYEVIVLLHDGFDDTVNRYVQTNEGTKIHERDCAKLLGCWDALADPTTDEFDPTRETGLKGAANNLRRCIAFVNTIKTSKVVSEHLTELVGQRISESEQPDNLLSCHAQHIDGTMNAIQRNEALDWLRNVDADEARVITNARCLTEGVDVPALDAVLFLEPKRSEVDVVQAVGRVMRTSPGKEKGYIVLPVLIEPGATAEEVVEGSDFKLVWSVLRALRAHDERFDAFVNLPNRSLSDGPIKAVLSGGVGGSGGADGDGSGGGSDDESGGDFAEDVTQAFQSRLPFEIQSKLMDAIFKNVGDSQYWPRWAQEVADHIEQIITQINDEIEAFPEVRVKHGEFLEAMRSTLNAEVSEANLTEMLAQHVVTLPVFNALFGGDSFAQHNPIARAMNTMLDALDQAGDTDMRGEQAQKLSRFYKSVETRLAAISPEDSESRLQILLELYEAFFKVAMPKQFAQLGVAYTPVQLVDFIIRSVDDLCRAEFGIGLTDENLHIIEPFVGTGTFLHRLLTIRTDLTDGNSPYIIRDEDIHRKFTEELHANEILLLAYYMASVKIEEGFKVRKPEADYTPYNGLVLADTFELTSHLRNETPELNLDSDLYENTQRTQRQTNHEMRVIIGNPPWSGGQKNAGDENPNISYPELEERIRQTYATRTNSNRKASLYNSYKMALRWASDRINPETGGIIGFILPTSIIEGNTETGVRACIAEEFTSVWVYNLLGNALKSGEAVRREGDKLFGSASRQGVCLLVLVKNPNSEESFNIHYQVVRDFSNLATKFSDIDANQAVGRISERWTDIIPDENFDWINQDQVSYSRLVELANEQGKKLSLSPASNNTLPAIKVLSGLYSPGIATGKDEWLYDYSRRSLEERINDMLNHRETTRQNLIATAPSDRESIFGLVTTNDELTNFKWTMGDKHHLERDLSVEPVDAGKIGFKTNAIREVHYRPFVKIHLYFDQKLLARTYRIPLMFPAGDTLNTALTIHGRGSGIGDFTTLATDSTSDLNIQRGGGQVIPRSFYARERSNQSYGQRCGSSLLDPNDGHNAGSGTDIKESGASAAQLYQDPPPRTERGDLLHGEGIKPAVLSVGDGHNTGSASHVRWASDSALRVSGNAMTPGNDGGDEAADVLPGIGLTELTGGDQPDADGKVDNITDWALSHFRDHYDDTNITKDDIWHYIYGALHAQDWRNKYANELTKYLPRIPMATTEDDFRKFYIAGETLMTLHLNYETINPWSLPVEIDGKTYAGEDLTAKTHNDPSIYRIDKNMRWAKLPGARKSGHKTQDRSVLVVNGKCQIAGIPAVAGNPYRGEDALDSPLTAANDDTTHLSPYIVNGKTPLEWAIAQLRVTTAKDSDIVNDANQWHVWQADEDAHKLVLHLLRLVRVSVETAQIVASLPAMPLADD